MKHRIKASFYLIIIMTLSSLIFAHPASEVNLSTKGSILTISFKHPAKDLSKHFIKTISVKKNKRLIIEQSLSMQEKNIQVLRYTIPSLKSGDIISVESVCNIFGKKTKSIVIK